MAPAMDPARDPFQLGDWQVDATGNRLTRGDEVRPLRHKAMELLVLLARHPGQTVSREAIVEAIWDGNLYVAPKAINTAVWTIRQALDDDAEAPRYLETIAKKGYRLIAPVRPLAAPAVARRPAAWAWAAAAALVVALGLGLLARPGRLAEPATTALPRPEPLTQNPGQEYVGRLSPDGRWLAFGWWRGRGDGGLYLRAAAEPAAEPQPLAPGSGDLQGLAWSPDGATLAFATLRAEGDCTLWRLDLADRQPRPLAACSPLFTPSVDWSPDGRAIVFSAEADGAGGLFRIGPDGQGLRRLTTAPPAAMADHQPAWSADGRRLAFVRQDPADGTRDLHETDAGGGSARRLTTLRLQTLHGLTALGEDLVFSTTQQEARVLMRWRRRDGALLPLGVEGSAPAVTADGGVVHALMRSHVGLAWLDGGQLRRLESGVGSDRMPAVEPGGAGRLAWVSRRSGHPELWLAAADGGGARALTRLEAPLAAPAWAPQGGTLAFVGACGPGQRIGLCRVEVDTGQVRPLAADAAGYGRPDWQPDGSAVWAASDRGGRWQLWRFPIDGGEPQALPTDEPPAALQWQPDGRALVYRPRLGDTLRWRPAAGGPERSLPVPGTGEALLDWRLGPQGTVLLVRGARERLVRLAPDGRPPQTLADWPLGTVPERARFALAADGRPLLEWQHGAAADLMVLRQVPVSTE